MRTIHRKRVSLFHTEECPSLERGNNISLQRVAFILSRLVKAKIPLEGIKSHCIIISSESQRGELSDSLVPPITEVS